MGGEKEENKMAITHNITTCKAYMLEHSVRAISMKRHPN